MAGLGRELPLEERLLRATVHVATSEDRSPAERVEAHYKLLDDFHELTEEDRSSVLRFCSKQLELPETAGIERFSCAKLLATFDWGKDSTIAKLFRNPDADPELLSGVLRALCDSFHQLDESDLPVFKRILSSENPKLAMLAAMGISMVCRPDCLRLKSNREIIARDIELQAIMKGIVGRQEAGWEFLSNYLLSCDPNLDLSFDESTKAPLATDSTRVTKKEISAESASLMSPSDLIDTLFTDNHTVLTLNLAIEDTCCPALTRLIITLKERHGISDIVVPADGVEPDKITPFVDAYEQSITLTEGSQTAPAMERCPAKDLLLTLHRAGFTFHAPIPAEIADRGEDATIREILATTVDKLAQAGRRVIVLLDDERGSNCDIINDESATLSLPNRFRNDGHRTSCILVISRESIEQVDEEPVALGTMAERSREILPEGFGVVLSNTPELAELRWSRQPGAQGLGASFDGLLFLSHGRDDGDDEPSPDPEGTPKNLLAPTG